MAFTTNLDEPFDTPSWPNSVSSTRSTINNGRNNKVDFNAQFGAKCLSLKAKAELDATVLSSPTLSATVDQNAVGQVILSYDLLNLHSISVVRELAEAKCRLSNAVTAAKALGKLSARKLSSHGAKARLDYIDRHLGRFNEMRKALKAAVQSGTVKERSATRVFKVLASVLERNNGLRAKVRQQDHININGYMTYGEIEQALNKATHMLHEAQREADLTRNVRFLVSGGYKIDRDAAQGGNHTAEEFGKATLSIRLGVLSSKWNYDQEYRLQVALDGFYEPDTGVLWQIKNAHTQMGIAADVYRIRKNELMDKLIHARQIRAAISKDQIAQRMLSEIEIIKVQSEIQEVKTNIEILNQVRQKLHPQI